MQPVYAAAILLVLSSGFAFAADAARYAFRPIPSKAPVGELASIHLQSAVGRHQQTLHITTQLLSKMNQTQSTIARNIR